jgi:hypothetical protein
MSPRRTILLARPRKYKTHNLKDLAKYVEQGEVVETHDDIPDSLREQLCAAENQ